VSHESTKLASLLIDPDWGRLRGRLERFNPFRVLRVADAELRHSEMLAWLLDPKGSHGFRDEFLRQFLIQIRQDASNGGRLEKWPTLLEILEMRLENVTVYRELDNIDLLVVIDNGPDDSRVLLIENKIYAAESNGQLLRYLAASERRFPSHKLMPLFLTLDGFEPSEKAYAIASHKAVAALLRSVNEQWAGRILPQVATFIFHYIEIIEEKTQVDQVLETLARQLFQTHESAIRLIYEVGTSRNLIQGWNLFLGRIDSAKIGLENPWAPSRGWVGFQLPEQRTQIVSSENWGMGKATCFWMRIEGDALRMVLEAGPWKDRDGRWKFIEFLKNAGFNVSNKEGGTYTRLASEKSEPIKDWGKPESVCERIEQLWTRLQPAWDLYREATSKYCFTYMPEA